MDEFKRLTPGRVLAAYEKTGLTPVYGCYSERGSDGKIRAACAVVAVVLAEYPWPQKYLGGQHGLAAVLGLPFDYVHGFIRAFDLDLSTVAPSVDRLVYQQGSDDGTACLAAVLPITQKKVK